MRPDLTVVIPTRDRRRRLAETLAALAEQAEGRVEAVVVDDGSSDGTVDFLAAYDEPRLPLRWFHQTPSGPAAARNRGIAEARAGRVLLLGDDTRPAPGALSEHLRAVEDLGVQGHIDWDPERPITPLMHFLAPAGPQFYFAGLRAGGTVPYTAVLASNLSAPVEWLRMEPFDEGFPDAAFEDTELAYRWRRRGWRVAYRPAALCWHRHHYDQLEPFLARQRRAGRAVRHALKRHPSMAPRIVVQPLLFGAVVWARLAWNRLRGRSRDEERWDLRCRLAFAEGLLELRR